MSNRRGFLKNISTAITSTIVATSIAVPETTSASAPVSLEPKMPTFEECYQKVLRNEDLTKLEVLVYSSEMNRLALESDMQVISELRATCATEQEFFDKRQCHYASRISIMHYWSVLHKNDFLHKNIKNLVNVHKYVGNSIVHIALQYHDYKTT